jgi:hypothetical protein
VLSVIIGVRPAFVAAAVLCVPPAITIAFAADLGPWAPAPIVTAHAMVPVGRASMFEFRFGGFYHDPAFAEGKSLRTPT